MSRLLGLQILLLSLLAIQQGPALVNSIQDSFQPEKPQGHTVVYFKNPTSKRISFTAGSVIRIVIKNEADFPQTYNWEVNLDGKRFYARTTALEAHQAAEINIIAPKPGLLELKFAERNLELKAIIE
jgi:hypothetical protein